MTTAETLLVDTNILVEATDEARRYHEDVLQLLSRYPTLVFTAQIVREYLVVATRPVAANGLGLPLDAAIENVTEFRTRIRLLPEEKPVLPVLLRLLAEVPALGKRIHDAHVVATAMAHKVKTIVTLNSADFAGFAAHVEAVTLSHRSLRPALAAGVGRRPGRKTHGARAVRKRS